MVDPISQGGTPKPPGHTLAVGTTAAAKYASLPGGTGATITKLQRSIAFICGLPGCGKSALFQSCPGAYIFNFDNTSTTTPTVRAKIWPWKDPATGLTLDRPGGTTALLRWEACLDILTLLKALSTNKNPDRPEIIVFDSLVSWVRLLCAYTVENAVGLGLRAKTSEKATGWKDLNGESAWDFVYETIINTIVTLNQHGYGVFVAGHLNRARPDKQGNPPSNPYEMVVGPGLWKRLYPILELSALLVSTKTTVSEATKTRLQDGQEIVQHVKRPTTQHVIEVVRADPEGRSKSRVKLPPIILPEKDAWGAFAAAYETAVEEAYASAS